MLSTLSSVLIVAYATVAAPTCPDSSKVMVDVTSLDASTYADLRMDDLYKSLLVRLLEEGVAVVGRDEPANMVLRFERIRRDKLRLELRWNGMMRSDEAAITDKRLADSHLAILHACVDLVRNARADCRDALADTARSSSVQAEVQREHVSRRHGVSIGAHVLYGARHAGLLTNLDYYVDLVPRSPWRWRVVAFFVPPMAMPEGLTTFEWGGATGPMFAPRLGAGWTWATSLTVGIDRASYVFTPPRQAGARLDPVLFAETGFGKSLSDDLALRLTAGVMQLPRSHVYDIDATIGLHIPATRFVGGLTMTYAW